MIICYLLEPYTKKNNFLKFILKLLCGTHMHFLLKIYFPGINGIISFVLKKTNN